ncbi:MAG: transglutaminase domain-containing protein [Spirochaetales bacterium]|nr:transglutaminase domain-containing protein [Spirochaetales bacterium]
MSSKRILADYDNELVRATAEKLAGKEVSPRKKLEKIFYFVRDEIVFAFPAKGDLVKASETIKSGKGQCNTKSALFLALCKAAGIPARIHFSLIRKEIQKGLFTGLAFRIMPDLISHSWIEVEVEGSWRRIDSFINDEDFYLAGKVKLKEQNWDTGYSIACSSSESSAAFSVDEEKFVQMDAVVDDHGYWNEPADYYTTDLYQNRPGFLTLLVYRFLIFGINRKVKSMRKSCKSGLCRGYVYESVPVSE